MPCFGCEAAPTHNELIETHVGSYLIVFTRKTVSLRHTVGLFYLSEYYIIYESLLVLHVEMKTYEIYLISQKNEIKMKFI